MPVCGRNSSKSGGPLLSYVANLGVCVTCDWFTPVAMPHSGISKLQPVRKANQKELWRCLLSKNTGFGWGDNIYMTWSNISNGTNENRAQTDRGLSQEGGVNLEDFLEGVLLRRSSLATGSKGQVLKSHRLGLSFSRRVMS